MGRLVPPYTNPVERQIFTVWYPMISFSRNGPGSRTSGISSITPYR